MHAIKDRVTNEILWLNQVPGINDFNLIRFKKNGNNECCLVERHHELTDRIMDRNIISFL